MTATYIILPRRTASAALFSYNASLSMTGFIFIMFNQLFAYSQYLLPQHLLSALAGRLAESRSPRLKNSLIRFFIHRYKVDLSEAISENLDDYPTFNSFFIRQLKPGIRPLALAPEAVISPVDGRVAALGKINQNQLLQAKKHYYNLETLLGNDKELATLFSDGDFATLYLAPQNYHRVHMPLSGTLTKSIYVPGKLFSVNRITSELIPNLYSRNERLISLFDTEAGKMAMILVGAMIVGSIQTVWMTQPIRSHQMITETFTNGLTLQKSAELGYFKMGSTVILLFEKNKVTWSPSFKTNSAIHFGQFLGKIAK
ncbi:archaetidylserine decarboxylase [Aquicella lusitana]|uniref:Phosphatidylserine decarboxylase proenzyme n=1 Tax=Aquicella lusitana TaxID=254246 RepID=A0A370GF25_9COXI|nr:archaetidylserine decarboxylase [Aquicella lusitana]RDI42412.1 phosphatidylserine decarboxylase [Aquicella lusitana]VVC74126.1 Phosphatidylserine decarboxylase proenzyme [Aquicella lusitana]